MKNKEFFKRMNYLLKFLDNGSEYFEMKDFKEIENSLFELRGKIKLKAEIYASKIHEAGNKYYAFKRSFTSVSYIAISRK
jgi:hypothetical protein